MDATGGGGLDESFVTRDLIGFRQTRRTDGKIGSRTVARAGIAHIESDHKQKNEKTNNATNMGKRWNASRLSFLLLTCLFIFLRKKKKVYVEKDQIFLNHWPGKNETNSEKSFFVARRSLRHDRPSHNRTIQIPIVIQLSGEFGNHLSKIAAGVGLAALLQSEDYGSPPYQFVASIHILHQKHTTKGENAMQIIQRCLLYLSSFADTAEYHEESNTPRHWQQEYQGINSHRDTVLNATLEQIRRDAAIQGTSSPNDTHVFATPLYSNHLVGFFDVYMDRFFHWYRELFAFRNETAECNCEATDPGVPPPFPDEIIFYYRGYSTEMPRKSWRLGFEEISPSTLVSYLTETRGYIPTPSRNKPSRIAIVSRFPGNSTQPYVDALEQAGFSVRVIGRSNDSATASTNTVASILHDFCFLRHAQRELIGPIRSTFFQWAAVLAQHPVRVTAYAMESQRLWAQEDAAIDSITPIHYYNHSETASQWQERNFFFPMFPSHVDSLRRT